MPMFHHSSSFTLALTACLLWAGLSMGSLGGTAVRADSVSTSSEMDSAADPQTSPTARRPLNDDGHIVNFQRDIAPIFRTHCLECHGPDDAKNDFRVDQPDQVFDYVEADDADSSSLFTDYLTTDDDDMLMPPRSHGGPLQPAELALVRLWINEGADWPEDASIDGSVASFPVADVAIGKDLGLVGRVWAFQGFLHPATVHFPIALLLLGGIFVVLGWKWPAIGTQIPMACLLIGAASSIAATLMGWSFSVQQGYGSWNRFDFDAEIFWHRWSAVIVTAMSAVFAVIALLSLRHDRSRLTPVWKIGLLLVAGLVGAVGHQGGELTYGKDFYPKAFRILLGTPEADPNAVSTASVKPRDES